MLYLDDSYIFSRFFCCFSPRSNICSLLILTLWWKDRLYDSYAWEEKETNNDQISLFLIFWYVLILYSTLAKDSGLLGVFLELISAEATVLTAMMLPIWVLAEIQFFCCCCCFGEEGGGGKVVHHFNLKSVSVQYREVSTPWFWLLGLNSKDYACERLLPIFICLLWCGISTL